MIDISIVKFDDKGLVPAVAQDADTLEVLMLAWMSRESLELTLKERKAWYFSRSRNSLWLKGETSGNIQEVRSVHYDCDADAILIMVEPKGPACHTGERTCFYRRLDEGGPIKPRGARVVSELFKILEERKKAEPGKSYVASLYAKGTAKILEKIEEESAELVEAAKEKENSEVLYEFCDLFFHSLVLLAHKGIDVEEAYAELARRFGISGIEEKESRGKK